jgi:beta-lactamase class A
MLRFAALTLACLAAAPAYADWDKAKLDREIGAIERDSKGRLGIALLDLKDRAAWSHRGAEVFPMQSVFKLPLAVAVLQAVEAGKLKLDQPVAVTRKDLSLYHSPLAARFKGERQDVPLRELIRLAAAESDNTAADLLMRLIGGPQTITAMLKAGGVTGISVDRYERVFQPEILGLPGYGWHEVIDTKAFRARAQAIPAAERRKRLEATLADRRDGATPDASASFLEAFAKGAWLREPAHSQLIEGFAAGALTGKERIRAGLPEGSRFAHKTGLGPSAAGLNHATNDIGIVTLPNGRVFAIAVYLAGSTGSPAQREAAHAAAARLAVAALR